MLNTILILLGLALLVVAIRDLRYRTEFADLEILAAVALVGIGVLI